MFNLLPHRAAVCVGALVAAVAGGGAGGCTSGASNPTPITLSDGVEFTRPVDDTFNVQSEDGTAPGKVDDSFVGTIKPDDSFAVGDAFADIAGSQQQDATQTDVGPQTSTFSPIKFAIIGDYGVNDANELAVSKLVKSHKPDFVLTTGDNNYVYGYASTIDKNVGKYYGSFIKPYKGKYGPGSPDINRFWPSPGNHDYDNSNGLAPYMAYFNLPNNERYYDFVRGAVHFISVDSDQREPDGTSASSKQGKWVKARLAQSSSAYKFVYFHHPPYNSGAHGPTKHMRWPWQSWGAHVTIAGHDHSYDRVKIGDVWHVVNGIGGRALYEAGVVSEGSQVRVYGRFGAMIVEVDDDLARFRTYGTNGHVLDEFALAPHGYAANINAGKKLFGLGSTWAYRDDGVFHADWKGPVASGKWSNGDGDFGYGDKVNTVVGFGGDKKEKHITTWFRRTVVVPDPGKYKYLRLQLRRDDGAVVYLNGKELWRVNLPSSNITHKTPASYTVSDALETDLQETVTLASGLQKGTNVFAVEIHQINKVTSDLRFDMAAWAFEMGK